MAVDNKLLKQFNNFKGIDLRSSDLTRAPEFASDLLNVDYRKSGSMTKRKGYQGKQLTVGGHGSTIFADKNLTTGKIEQRYAVLDENLHIQKTSELNIAYTGATSAYIDLSLKDDGSEFVCDIYENNTLLNSIPLGLAIDQAAPFSVDALASAISLETGFTASASSNGTQPAAFLDITRNLNLEATSKSISFNYYDTAALPGGASTPFSLHYAQRADNEFENASFANVNGVMYISTGYDALYKFDGTRLYKAGLPQATTPLPVTAAGTPGPSNANIQYKVVYRYTDAKGNIIFGDISAASAKLSPAGNSVDITVDNILNTTGFDTDSSDLIIEVYRNLTEDSTTFYLIAEVVNDGTSATQVVTDNTADANVGVVFVEPLKGRGLPPVGKYITVVQGLLIVGGDNSNVDTVYYSDIDSPEYFDISSNFNVQTKSGDKVTGLAPQDNLLIVFKNNSAHFVDGDISDDSFRVGLMNNSDIGCVAHHSIAEVGGSLYFLSKKGVYAIGRNDRSLEEVSGVIEPLFTSWDQPFNFKKAVAVNWIEKDKYMLHMPVDDANSPDTTAAGDTSRLFVYDYFRESWTIWSNINASGGMAVENGTLNFTERRATVAVDTRHHSYKMLDSGDTWDYADHATAITFSYKSHWETLGEPSMFKKFLRMKIHSLEASIGDFESDSFSLTLRTEADFVDNFSALVDLNFGIPGTQGWGEDSWGEFPWGHARLLSVRTKLKSAKYKSLRTVLINSELHKNILISGYEMEVAVPYKAFIKE